MKIDQIDDALILGSIIYSSWYLLEYSNNEALFDTFNRQWFITALSRLADITSDQEYDPLLFHGKLKKIAIRSNNINYLDDYEPETEVEQQLTITIDGRIIISRFKVNNDMSEIENTSIKLFKIDQTKADKIFFYVSRFFKKEYRYEYMDKDVGVFILTLTNDQDNVFIYTGSLNSSFILDDNDLSDIIRENTGTDDLFVFDNNSDRIERIEINYNCETNIIQEKEINEQVSESLIIDGKSGILEHYRKLNGVCKFSIKLMLDEEVRYFLNRLEYNLFSLVSSNRLDIVEDIISRRDYNISISTRRGNDRIISGVFDKSGLPLYWDRFIVDVRDFMMVHGLGEIFDSRVYGRYPKRESEYIFCNVVFQEDGKEYCYLTEDETLRVGDVVAVPVGWSDNEVAVKIASIEYHQPEDAPYSLDKIKYISGRFHKKVKCDCSNYGRVFCPLMGYEINHIRECFDIATVAAGLSPPSEALDEVLLIKDFEKICLNCKNHIFDDVT
ncbi:MAG: hypothetical protein FD141_741 [Fusobacteria bacterium]|nr:MAG: hypothetical protein FD141_741 [Fusobacteriota bacterium]KAF0228593.1 MAG: hypothetical protein FD182_849 [Fusobacteriota bacterium]